MPIDVALDLMKLISENFETFISYNNVANCKSAVSPMTDDKRSTLTARSIAHMVFPSPLQITHHRAKSNEPRRLPRGTNHTQKLYNGTEKHAKNVNRCTEAPQHALPSFCLSTARLTGSLQNMSWL